MNGVPEELLEEKKAEFTLDQLIAEVNLVCATNEMDPVSTPIYRMLTKLSDPAAKFLSMAVSREEKLTISCRCQSAFQAMFQRELAPLPPKKPLPGQQPPQTEAQQQLNQGSATPPPFTDVLPMSTVGKLELINKMLTPVARSNLYTMGITARELKDHRQQVPHEPTMPDLPTRLLRGQLCVEEAGWELLSALGLQMRFKGERDALTAGNTTIEQAGEPNWNEAVDACCDGIYVLVGTLMALGAMDAPHLQHVCDCNDAKFPHGTAVPHPTIPGKFGKPEGWKAPDHGVVVQNMKEEGHYLDLGEATKLLIEAAQ